MFIMRDYETHRPTVPRVLWAAGGGYWSETDLNEILKEE